MPRQLSIADKLLSLRGCILVTDEDGRTAYEARGEFAMFSPAWTVFKGEQELLTIRRRIFTWRPTWEVEGSLGSFLFRRKLLAWRRRYYVVGGDFDGAEVKGSLWDMRFEVMHASRMIAAASDKLFSLRDRQSIDMKADDAASEAFTVCAMIVLHLDRKHEASASASAEAAT